MNDMKRHILLFITLIVSLTSVAQEKKDTVVITLQNGQEVRYTSDLFDRVQIIYNLRYGVKVYLKDGKSKDYLATKVVIAQYDGEGQDVTDNNRNRNRYRAKLLEYPHLAEDESMNQLVIKSTSNYGITFSLEWSYADIANRWTCYQMHAGNLAKNVSRSDHFMEDPEIPSQYRSTPSDYSGSGFTRGHLCPSFDRLCSKEQNQQTFYLSNMHPQYSNHNSGLWNALEQKLRTWAVDCDTLYVVKAATIRSDQVLSVKCNDRLPVPKYFYMALLAYTKKTDSYQAIGLWTEHNNSQSYSKKYGDYAITIDELEERTGIDFFCNLPDDTEDEVEGKINLGYWSLSKSK